MNIILYNLAGSQRVLSMFTETATGIDIKSDDIFERILHDIKRHAYPTIGEGSGRIVYDLGNGYVVKAAVNDRGIAQNEAEFKISAGDHSGLLAQVAGVSENFDLLLMAKAEKIRNISFVWNYFKVESNVELFQIEPLQETVQRHDLILIDLGRASSWGKVDGRPVIVDYGFTWKVKRRYYQGRPLSRPFMRYFA